MPKETVHQNVGRMLEVLDLLAVKDAETV